MNDNCTLLRRLFLGLRRTHVAHFPQKHSLSDALPAVRVEVIFISRQLRGNNIATAFLPAYNRCSDLWRWRLIVSSYPLF